MAVCCGATQRNKWLPSRCSFPAWLSAAEHVQMLLMRRAPSESRTNFAEMATTPKKCWQLIAQSGAPCPPLGFLKPRRLGKAIVSSDCPGKTAVMSQKELAPPRTLTFQGGFLQDLHGIELTSVGACDLPHQEHLRSRKHTGCL